MWSYSNSWPLRYTVLARLQVDTKDILFICGGAFIDLDRQVSERTHEASLGFGNPVRRKRYSLICSFASCHDARSRCTTVSRVTLPK